MKKCKFFFRETTSDTTVIEDYVIDTEDLPAQRHTLYAQGRDSQGYTVTDSSYIWVFTFNIDEVHTTKYFDPYSGDSARIFYEVLPDSYSNPNFRLSPLDFTIKITDRNGGMVCAERPLTFEEQSHQLIKWDGRNDQGEIVELTKLPCEVTLNLQYQTDAWLKRNTDIGLVKLNLNVFEANKGSQVPEEDEESIGAIEIVNDDDDGPPEGPDNGNEVIDGDLDSLDMIKLRLTFKPSTFADGEIELIADEPSRVRVFNEDGAVVNFPEQIDIARFEEGFLDYYVEGITPGIVMFTLRCKDSEGYIIAEDIVKVRVGVEIVMTFDDGPVGDRTLGVGLNETENVLNDLKNNCIQNNIKAAFFLLSHMEDRGGSAIGEQLIKIEDNRGHVLSAHGGGKGDHQHHTDRVPWFSYPPYKVDAFGNVDQGEIVGTVALESDMIALIRRLRYILINFNYNPQFVRPPEWERNDWVLDAYRSDAVKTELNGDSLRMILRDIWGRDTGIRTGDPDEWKRSFAMPFYIRRRLENDTEDCIDDGKYHLVVVLHDRNDWTAANLADPDPSYLDAIVEGGKEAGVPQECLIFVTSGDRIREILKVKYERGDWKYPGQ